MAHRICFILIFILLNVTQGFCDDDESKYRASFSSGAESCKDFKNDKFNADNMNLGQMESEDEDGAGLMCIEGSLELSMEIGDDVMIKIDIAKETAVGAEPMFSVLMSICECLKDEDAPWKPIFAAMGIESCPIKKATYAVKDMVLDLNFAKDVITHENCGDYIAEITMEDNMQNVIACYNMYMAVEEVS